MLAIHKVIEYKVKYSGCALMDGKCRLSNNGHTNTYYDVTDT